jgi:hypothetical protein
MLGWKNSPRLMQPARTTMNLKQQKKEKLEWFRPRTGHRRNSIQPMSLR